jgi:hypothetical protein
VDIYKEWPSRTGQEHSSIPGLLSKEKA